MQDFKPERWMDEDEDVFICEGYGRTDTDEGRCPLCCSFTFAPGSEECEWCEDFNECAEHAMSL